MERYGQIVIDIERWLTEADYHRGNTISDANVENQHYEHFDFWWNGAKAIIVHTRVPFARNAHPHPICDLYRPLEETGYMEATRKAIFAYAGVPETTP